MPIVDAYSSECVLAFVNKLTKKTPEGVYAGCVGVSKSYVEWYWKVEQCINNKCEQERRRDGDVLLNTLEVNKTYINITTTYIKSIIAFQLY